MFEAGIKNLKNQILARRRVITSRDWYPPSQDLALSRLYLMIYEVLYIADIVHTSDLLREFKVFLIAQKAKARK